MSLNDDRAELKGEYFCPSRKGQPRRMRCRKRFLRVMGKRNFHYFESAMKEIVKPEKMLETEFESSEVPHKKGEDNPENFPFEAHQAFRNAQLKKGLAHSVLREIGMEEPGLLKQVLGGDYSGLEGRENVAHDAPRRFLGSRRSDDITIPPFSYFEALHREQEEAKKMKEMEECRGKPSTR
jgi:hypothetical protein